ncbi:MAG: exosortase/archaeosortase family protein [Verrucomicrobiota bacterium JB022]|nr:exosortase/archaeosortase family protein [Verrucomicrobiota bacterium JB022]
MVVLPPRQSWPLLLTGTGLALLWAHFITVFAAEWAIDEQYSYGFIVPLCTAYLLYLRWPERPSPDASRTGWLPFVLLSLALLFVPLAVIRGSNPEWRAALWLEGLLVYGLSLLVLWRQGGWPWLRHFGPALALMLVAIPWPRDWENTLVNGLMRGVAAVVVEIMNLMGHYAMQQGNLVFLRQGVIGVEEACSGVRSLQSTLMAAVFLGLLFRWRFKPFLGLVLLGGIVSLGLNILRTLTLTWLTVQDGPTGAKEWHDPLGQAVALLSFAVLFALTWLLHRWWRPQSRLHPPPAARSTPGALPLPASVGLGAVLLLAPLVSAAWYHTVDHRHEVEVAAQVVETVPFKQREIPERVQALLRFSEGAHYVWTDVDGTRYTLFFFYWGEGQTSSHAGVHRPEVCLPSAGYKMVAEEAPLAWEGGPLTLEFETFRFSFAQRPLFVFFSVWDEYPGHQVPIANDWRDRLANVWNRERVQGRYSVELIIEPGPQGDLARARQQAEGFLDRHLQLVSAAPSVAQP